jgi:hypothetical protein
MGRSISTDTSNQQTITHLPTHPRAPSSTTILPPPILTRILTLFVNITSLLAQSTLPLNFIVRAAEETRIRASDRYFAAAGSAGTESVALGRAAVEGAAAAEELWVVDSAHFFVLGVAFGVWVGRLG